MKIFFFLLVGVYCVFTPPKLAAEPKRQITQQHELWATFSMNNIFNDKWNMTMNLPQTRTFFAPWRHDNVFVSALPQWKVLNHNGNALQIGAGLSHWWIGAPENQVAGFHITTEVREIRPVLSVQYTSHLGKNWKLTNRFWNEFRNFDYRNGQGYQFHVVRWRYLIGLSYRPIQSFSFNVSDEFFVNIINKYVGHIYDQNRLSFSVTYHATEDLGLEIGYMNWFQQLKPLKGINRYVNQNNILFTLHYAPNWKNILHRKSKK